MNFILDERRKSDSKSLLNSIRRTQSFNNLMDRKNINVVQEKKSSNNLEYSEVNRSNYGEFLRNLKDSVDILFPTKTCQIENNIAALYKVSGMNILNLQGSFFQMGKQYGTLMSETMKKTHNVIIVENFVNKQGKDYDELFDAGKKLYGRYSLEYQNFIKGMAETSGLTMKEQVTLLGLEHYANIAANIKKENNSTGFCSGIGAWGPFTKDSELIFGRNYDFPEYYKSISQDLTITVFHPENCNDSIANITFPGVFYTTTAMNTEGMFLELNNGTPSSKGEKNPECEPLIIKLFHNFLHAKSLNDLDNKFSNINSDQGFIINVSDNKESRSFEWTMYEMKRRTPDEDGLLVSTNHFINPEWKLEDPTNNNLWKTKDRRDNLIALAQANKGQITPKTIQNFLDTKIEEGGPTFKDLTLYQIIAKPQTKTLWIKIPEHQNWTKINLDRLLHKAEQKVLRNNQFQYPNEYLAHSVCQ